MMKNNKLLWILRKYLIAMNSGKTQIMSHLNYGNLFLGQEKGWRWCMYFFYFLFLYHAYVWLVLI